ncbi:hypothetical protein A1F94_002699 [Pyrenophora tritici-repentis]|uniref:Uncharacterized protein n=2 Tax=Pyrenophora tritici-repentis TaxID=45151 RepID=A0A2W1FB41_9PLEO|nr:uncharacterized protein PTRG_03294 [Pyrenophora tritici-repentis Pt-1C-BFP]KAA8622600.1 hypothetical protein PtrV1_03906 [Pyrenophora tritici-repentis]EDU45817.1 conserved hypothetical protein [Pyrenophora tritici-repentis Pt-1C-BFP]KAF7451589.1 hypothetical protein A1F99_033660 [Pyrenophora tritici-repentis]KAF7575301.1 hypothetical protein PtrM4_069250 [Pyrenophora tritici-repentis]KAG9385949.1 hypothetical protein A1F94_002699 [Pyrenophora tritici-repentis]
MAAHFSSDFLRPDDDREDRYDKNFGHHRSRSGGYVDHLEEQARWDRRDRERQMKRYHDSQYGRSSSSRYFNQPTSPDRLGVPVFEINRKPRSSSHSDARERELKKDYNVREVRPGPAVFNDEEYARDSNPLSQLPVRTKPKPQHQKKPSIKVDIHQDKPPIPSMDSASTPKRSPNASPRSPIVQPQLLYQFEMVQNKLSQINKTCAPYIDVEAAKPQDLTFEKISEQANAFSFDLEVCAHITNLDGLAAYDLRKKGVLDAASKGLDRLIDSITELNSACSQAKPKDLKFEKLPKVDDDNLFNEDDYDGDEPHYTDSLSFVIHACLHSIELQIQNLKLLSRTLQEATPDARDEVDAVSRIVAESVKYFGSKEALRRYSIDERFSGRKALEEARIANSGRTGRGYTRLV